MSIERSSVTSRPCGSTSLFRDRRFQLFLGATGLLALIGISCHSVNRTISIPMTIPGATFVGTQTCADCHDVLVRDFVTASHAQLMAEGPNALDVGCESCHGPGSLHADSGEPSQIINPGSSPQVCYECHLQARSQFRLPHHHPVHEEEILQGRLSCNDCHGVHKGDAIGGRGTDLMTANQRCLECHPAQQGPFVFEHEALREGCTVCHAAHGSVNAKLLTQRNATLCLRCHFQQQTRAGGVEIGGVNHNVFLSRGTCWSAGCHEAVHGSQVNSSLLY